MSRIDDVFEQLVTGAARRLSSTLLMAYAATIYVGIGLVVPLVFDFSKLFLVLFNLLGAILAVCLVLAWLGLQYTAATRRHLIEWTTDLNLLSPSEFEWIVGELFRREGWSVIETGRMDGPDGGIDLVLVRDGERRVVQCKRWHAPVGVKEVRAFMGTLLRSDGSAQAGTFVTLSEFFEQARQEAEAKGVELVDGKQLHERIEAVRRAEPCPLCASAMVLGRNEYGWWLRCTATPCRGKRNLSDEPGRAVALLLRQESDAI